MNIRETKEWVESIDPNEATDDDHRQLEELLLEVEIVTDDLSEALRQARDIETSPDFVSQKDIALFERTADGLEERFELYWELERTVEEKFQQVDHELYG